MRLNFGGGNHAFLIQALSETCIGRSPAGAVNIRKIAAERFPEQQRKDGLDSRPFRAL